MVREVAPPLAASIQAPLANVHSPSVELPNSCDNAALAKHLAR